MRTNDRGPAPTFCHSPQRGRRSVERGPPGRRQPLHVHRAVPGLGGDLRAAGQDRGQRGARACRGVHHRGTHRGCRFGRDQASPGLSPAPSSRSCSGCIARVRDREVWQPTWQPIHQTSVDVPRLQWTLHSARGLSQPSCLQLVMRRSTSCLPEPRHCIGLVAQTQGPNFKDVIRGQIVGLQCVESVELVLGQIRGRRFARRRASASGRRSCTIRMPGSR